MPGQDAGSGDDGPDRPSGSPLPFRLHENLPSAPHVVSRLISLGDDADTSELRRVIDSDPALTARILRTANSPFFAQARSVTSVQRAIVVLGLTMVRNLTLGLTVWDAAAGQIPAAHARHLWDHSLAVAHGAQRLATVAGSCEAADAFTAGLLHDVGKLVLARHAPDAYRSLWAASGRADDLPARERALFGHDHAAIAALLFEHWRLPHVILEAVGQHHDAAPEAGLPSLVAAVNELHGKRVPATGQLLELGELAGVAADTWVAYASQVKQRRL